jgi:hypothetical protein
MSCGEFLIKGWSASRIAARLKVSLITIQKLLEIGREQLKRKVTAPVGIETERERLEAVSLEAWEPHEGKSVTLCKNYEIIRDITLPLVNEGDLERTHLSFECCLLIRYAPDLA